jgi:hypothetical protein
MGEPVQFRLSTLLLVVTFVSISLGGIAVWTRIVGIPFDEFPENYFVQVVFWSPYWLPWVLLAYALGRRKLTARTVLAFLLGEVIFMTAILWISKTYMW